MDQPQAGTSPAIALGVALFLAIYSALAVAAVTATGWPPVYPLDDTYTQMALARTLAASGTFGFVAGVPAFCSSAPLWVLVLALVSFVIPLSLAPATLSVVAGTMVIVVAVRYLARRGVPRAALMSAAAAIVIAPSMPAIAAIGLEHVAHTFLTVSFAIAVVTVAGDATPRRRHLWLLPLAAVTTACRLEGYFLVAAAALLLARRRFTLAVAIVIASFVPLAVHAAFAVPAGWYAVPAPLVIKGNYPAEGSVAGVAVATGTRAVRIADLVLRRSRDLIGVAGIGATTCIALIGLAIAFRRRMPFSADVRMSLLFLGTLVFHAWLATLDRTFGRYQLYLLVLGIIAATPWVASIVSELRRSTLTRAQASLAWMAIAIAGLVFSAAVLTRSTQVTLRAHTGSVEIFQQQYQMSRFAAEHYAGQSVVLNDLGLLTYLGRVNPVDIAGLATPEMALLIKSRSATPSVVDELARAKGARVAIVYASWVQRLARGVPETWVPVAELVGPPTEVAAHPVVTFYALEAAHAQRLRDELETFAPSLPPASRLVWVD